jgi:hypothetical protein
VIVLVIDKDRVLAFEDEGQSPASIDPDRPMPGELSLQFNLKACAWIGVVDDSRLA